MASRNSKEASISELKRARGRVGEEDRHRVEGKTT